MTVHAETCMSDHAPHDPLSAALCWLNEWRGRVRWRKNLARFTARELDDIGVLPDQAKREARKPFWIA